MVLLGALTYLGLHATPAQSAITVTGRAPRADALLLVRTDTGWVLLLLWSFYGVCGDVSVSRRCDAPWVATRRA